MKVKSLALCCALLACAGVAKATSTFNVDLPNTSLGLTLSLNGATLTSPNPSPIPITGGAIYADDNGSALSNAIGTPPDGILVADPWVIGTIFGNLVLSGGHISVGDLQNDNSILASPGPFAYSGGTIDLSGLGVVLDGGSGTFLGNSFDFSTSPVGFNAPGGTSGSYDGTELTIPISVSGTTDLGGGNTLGYALNGQLAFTRVPEPGTIALAVMGLCAVAPFAVRRLRKGC